MKKSILILLFATLFFCGIVRVQLVAQEDKTEGNILAMPKEIPSPNKEEMRLQGEETDFVLKNNIGQSLINDVVKPDPDYLELQKKRLEIAQKNQERAKQQRAENKISAEQLDQAELLLAEAEYAYKTAASPRLPGSVPANRGIHFDDVNPDYIKLLKFRLQIAQKNMERAQKLFEAKVVSDLERDDVRLKLMEAEYALKKAEQLYEVRQLNNGPITAEFAPEPATETKIDPEELQLLKFKVEVAKKKAEITQQVYETGGPGGTTQEYYTTQTALADMESKLYRYTGDRANYLAALTRKADVAKKLVDATQNSYNAGVAQVTALLEAQQTLAEAELELKKAKEEKGDARPKRLTPPQTEERSDAAVPEREKFLYDNRTFWEWKKQAETELNPDRHIDIVKAFGAFARKGFGKEATEAILKILEDTPDFQVRTNFSNNQKEAFPLAFAVAEAFWRNIPDEDSIPILLKLYENADVNKKKLAFGLLMLSATTRKTKEKEELFNPVGTVILDYLRNNPELCRPDGGLGTGPLNYEFYGPCVRLADENPNFKKELEQIAFRKGDLRLRRFAFNVLVHGFQRVIYNVEEFHKYLPKLVDLLISDDKGDQEFAGKTIRYYCLGERYRLFSYERDFLSQWTTVAEFDSKWCDPDDSQGFAEIIRQMIQSLMLQDETGVQTARYLKWAYSKYQEIVKSDFDNLFGIEVHGTDFDGRETRRFLAPLYRNFKSNTELTPRGENLRNQLEDSPDLLTSFDELVTKIQTGTRAE